MKKVKIITSTLLAASMLASCSPAQEADTSSKSKADTGYEEKIKIPKGYEGKCGECREEIEDDYKFCAHCGTKVGEGSFEPYENYNECVYGAPQDYTLKCTKCGYTIEDSTMDGIPSYCPYCGIEAEVTIKDPFEDDEDEEDFADDFDDEEISEEE